MDNPIPVDLGRVAQDLQIRRVQVESVVQLLDEGNTVPFITRYRKERTGNLNEVVIREIQLRVQRLRELAERKETILKAIEAQGKLNPDLAAAIRAAENPKRLEDLYLPFKPKKRTKASDAREKGLEPLAVRIWNRDEQLTDLIAAAQEFVNAEKGLETPEKVLEGVGHILAEAISEMAAVRDAVRKVVWKTGKIVTTKGEIPEGQGLEYRDYFDYSEPLSQVPPHRVLAINRGDKEGPLKIKLEVSRPELEAAFFHQLPLEGHPQADFFRGCGHRRPGPPDPPQHGARSPPRPDRGRREARRRGLRTEPSQPAAAAADPQASRPGHRPRTPVRMQGRRARPARQPARSRGHLSPRAPESTVRGQAARSRTWSASTRSASSPSATARPAGRPKS